MSQILGGIGCSHIPAISNAITNQLQDTPYWQSFFAGYQPIYDWLDDQQPDVAVIFYNDHGLNFFLDNKPTFAIGAAEHYHNADEGWGIKTIAPLVGDIDLSWHIINELVADEFDVSVCQEMRVDHGATVPMALLWPKGYQHVRVIPVCLNIERHPMPSAKRCFKLGESIGRAIRGYSSEQRVVILGTGGLSHQLDGERAGFINKPFDLYCMDKLIDQPELLTELSVMDYIEQGGTQGPEFNMWLAMRGALGNDIRKLHQNYTVPISNTGAGTMLIECL